MILSSITAIPFLGALTVVVFRRSSESIRWLALSFAALPLILTLHLCSRFDRQFAGMQFSELHPWIPSLGIDYHLGIDGLGLTLLLLTAIVTLMALAAAWKWTDRPALYFSLILALETCLIGAFTALNFVHWFTFWELSLVPAYFLIKLWGGPGRSAAAMQFLVYTMVGGVAMLLGFVAVFHIAHTFDFVELAEVVRSTSSSANASLPLLAFLGILLGLAVKVPMWPFHTWLPDAYSEAPSSTTMLLTGVMSKMGLYGFLRILLPCFGGWMSHFAKPLLWLAVGSILFPALAALAQKDIKRLLAYSSMSHLGYCLLAIFASASTAADVAGSRATALDGAMLQIVNHGITAALLFWFVSLLERRTTGLRSLDDFGGIRSVAPVLAGLMGIAIFSSLGLPGLNGFVGEFLILKGTFPLAPWASALSLLGLLITAVFLLGLIQRVFTGALSDERATFTDLTRKEISSLSPVTALLFLFGLLPQLLLQFLNPAAMQMAQQIHR